jgi:hypothetical protein
MEGWRRQLAGIPALKPILCASVRGYRKLKHGWISILRRDKNIGCFLAASRHDFVLAMMEHPNTSGHTANPEILW